MSRAFPTARRSNRPLWAIVCLVSTHLALSLLAGCAAGGGAGDPLAIRGVLTHPARIALPSESVAVVELSRAQDGRVIAEQRQELAGRQVPVPFELKVHRSVLEPDALYFVRGSVAWNGRTRWISEPVEVRAGPETIELGPLTLRPYEPAAFNSRLVCGDRTASVGVARIGERDILQLTVGAERFELYQTVTASGARYEAVNDPRSFVWFKGQRATLVVRGEAYPECIVAG